ncbi:MAG: hypothetical protein P4L85_25530 [Paludisphaera borealis]|uniref:hypothetical protein n=1 Tax=Paludisphaera borealis TaxID=1387353 RepID=UPI00283CAF95|nr:hypothetical protein [Paludisphaera borealis]MDR3622740.1 hypothetical protein [Paludisphaera borealis]
MIGRRGFLLACTLISVAGCGHEAPPPAVAEKPVAPARNARIPIEVSYPIIKDYEEYNAHVKKRTVDVRLNTKVSLETLKEIAVEIKGSEKHQYEMTYIFYYMPERGGAKNAPWAISHFNPTLELDIMGLTKEQEETLRTTPLDHPGKRIGAWLIDVQYGGHVALIYDDSGAVKMKRINPSGKPLVTDMAELPTDKGRRFKKATGTDVYEVDPSGVLRLYDSDGKLIWAAEPLG